MSGEWSLLQLFRANEIIRRRVRVAALGYPLTIPLASTTQGNGSEGHTKGESMVMPTGVSHLSPLTSHCSPLISHYSILPLYHLKCLSVIHAPLSASDCCQSCDILRRTRMRIGAHHASIHPESLKTPQRPYKPLTQRPKGGMHEP